MPYNNGKFPLLPSNIKVDPPYYLPSDEIFDLKRQDIFVRISFDD